MDDTTLRRACAVAEIDAQPHPIKLGWWHVKVEPSPLGAVITVPQAWVESRCSSLLVAKARERGVGWRYYTALMLEVDALATECRDIASLATDEQRIAAALEVLE